MNRLRLNFIIDFLALTTFVLMSSTGFVLKFLLPSRSGRMMGAGTGWRAASKPVSLLWEGSRQDWGNIHWWLSIGFLVIVSIHFFLHLNWIVCVIRKQPKKGSGMRLFIGLTALLILLAFAIGLFISPVKKVPRSQILMERHSEMQIEHDK